MPPTELFRKYRPRTLDEVVGQPQVIKALTNLKDRPHCYLFKGPSGVGKTTVARIWAVELGCKDGADYAEINCGVVESPIDTVREIQRDMGYAAVAGNTARVWVLDEAQALSRASFAQQSLLKILEEPPDEVYFMLCTTDDKKLLPTIRNRCCEIAFKAIPDKDLIQLVRTVAKREKATVNEQAIENIVTAAEGSARRALQELQRIIGFEEDEQADAVQGAGIEKAAFDLVKVLMPWQGSSSWDEVVKVLKDIEEEEPEKLRQLLLASARGILLSPKSGMALKGRAVNVINAFREPLYDRNSGRALIAGSCFEIVCPPKRP